jgi:hypothetical protein
MAEEMLDWSILGERFAQGLLDVVAGPGLSSAMNSGVERAAVSGAAPLSPQAPGDDDDERLGPTRPPRQRKPCEG